MTTRSANLRGIGLDDAEQWTGPREQIPLLIAETFERGGELLAEFSDEQLDQGFWYLAGAARPEFMQTLTDQTIPLQARLRALRSFVPLFQQIMTVRCTNHLGHIDRHGEKPLNSACYMWWDLLRFELWWPNRPDILADIITTLRACLAIPHDACRESALHGIGHLRRDYPEYEPQLAAIIDDFLASTSGLRPELIAYADQARRGEIL